MIPLDDVVDRLRRRTARHVILALDASRLQTDWRMGLLTNDVVAEAMSQWATPANQGSTSTPLSILLAAGPGESSWPADGRSEFVAALIAGLSGEADGSGPAANGAKDRRVTLQELVAFLQNRVRSDVVARFGAAQTVQHIGNNADFPLAVVSEPRTPKSSEPKKDVDKKEPDKKAESVVVATDGKPATEPAKDATPPPKTPKFNWDARLAEIRATRDALRDSGRDGLLRRRMPFTWRSLNAQLELVEASSKAGSPTSRPKLSSGPTSSKNHCSRPPAGPCRPSPPRMWMPPAACSASQSPRPQHVKRSPRPESICRGLPLPFPERSATCATPADQIPDVAVIQTWLRQQLLTDPNARAPGRTAQDRHEAR